MTRKASGGKGVVLLVDDDLAVQRGVEALLLAADYKVKIFHSGDDYLKRRAEGGPDGAVMLLDVYMPGIQGLDLQARLKAEKSAVPVIIMTAHGDVPMAVKAMRGGAVDFLEKPFTASELMASLDRAFSSLQRNVPIAPPVPELQSAYDTLTAREREVLQEIVCGETSKEIAKKLNISPRTIEVHRQKIMTKMGAESFAELVRMAVALGVEC